MSLILARTRCTRGSVPAGRLNPCRELPPPHVFEKLLFTYIRMRECECCLLLDNGEDLYCRNARRPITDASSQGRLWVKSPALDLRRLRQEPNGTEIRSLRDNNSRLEQAVKFILGSFERALFSLLENKIKLTKMTFI